MPLLVFSAILIRRCCYADACYLHAAADMMPLRLIRYMLITILFSPQFFFFDTDIARFRLFSPYPQLTRCHADTFFVAAVMIFRR